MDERKNVLEMAIGDGGAEITTENGHTYFADNNVRVEIIEAPNAVYYDENAGYVLPDGRSLDAIIIE